jgi:hypothetical protein
VVAASRLKFNSKTKILLRELLSVTTDINSSKCSILHQLTLKRQGRKALKIPVMLSALGVETEYLLTTVYGTVKVTNMNVKLIFVRIACQPPLIKLTIVEKWKTNRIKSRSRLKSKDRPRRRPRKLS